MASEAKPSTRVSNRPPLVIASEAKQSIFSKATKAVQEKIVSISNISNRDVTGLAVVKRNKKELLFLKKKKQKDFAPGGVGAGIAYNRLRRRRL